MDIKILNIQGTPIEFSLNGGAAQTCRPDYKNEPCVPQAAFCQIEECQVCKRIF